METPSVRPAARRLSQALGRTAAIAALLSALASPAWAIPSPDVMVNLFASSAQVLGLVSVLLGRWIWVRRRRGAAATAGRGYRSAFLASLGLCAVACVGWALYAAQVADERNERLQVNLNRNSREDGRKVVDVSLRELSFSKQLEREDGLATEDLQARLESGARPQVLDVRESEEFEAGGIAGAKHARFPDVLAEPARFVDRSRPVTLVCFNGNRSSELAEVLRAAGFTTSFVVGGYEKWLAEDRPIEYRLEGERRELREIADYPNKDVLLDTPDVHRILAEREVVFLDVRYPGDFETLGHLPGAINVPFRKLTTPELDEALAALPKKPVIVPCYDKRSSFFGLIAGLRLTRMGYEYLGRYSVPEGFAVASAEKAHVAAWKAAHAEETLLHAAAEPLAGALAWCRARVGSLLAAILLLVLAVRIALLPLTARAERDRRREAELAPEIEALRARFADDPAARAAASLAILRRHGVRPVWNLSSSAAQILLFTLFFGAVSTASRGSAESWLWIGALGAPDPTWALPIASGVLMALLVWLPATRRTWKRGLLAVLAGAAIVTLVAPLSAGVQVYLVANLALVHVHNVLVGAWIAWRAGAEERRARTLAVRYATAVVVPLRHARHVADTGAKAARLGRLLDAGLPVPDGFVVRPSAFSGGRLRADARAEIRAAHARLGAARVAVRSSGANEDGAQKSYAGVFESVLDVDAAGLEAALESVLRSWSGARVDAYSAGGDETGGIVVQTMVPAAWAGVLFTEHPGESGSCAIEMVEGLGEDLVAGRRAPRSFRLGRRSGRLLDQTEPPIDLAPLFHLGSRVEELFGGPQDVEWAFAGGSFHLLQARDVTSLARRGEGEHARRERERHRLLEHLRGAAADEPVLVQDELSELLPEPTPFSLSLMERLWDHDGAAHRACRALGIPYDVTPDSPPLLVTAFGRLYVDRRESRRRTARGPSALAAFRLARSAEGAEEAWRESHRPAAERAARLDAAIDLGRLTLDELVTLHRERARRFVEEDYARAEEVNVAADVHVKTALREIGKRGLDPAALLSCQPPTVVHEAARILGRVGRGECPVEEFVAHSGHRAPRDWELASPRHAEDPSRVRELAAQHAAAHERLVAPYRPTGRRVLDLAVERALRWQSLKEEAKHLALRDLSFLRRLTVEIGARTGFHERVFLLRVDEVGRLDDATWRSARAHEIVADRDGEREAFDGVRLPARFGVRFLEDLDLRAPGAIPRPHAPGAVRGTRVSGDAGVVGRARVLHDAAAAGEFQGGEILVARFTDPAWMPLFPRARAIVTEVGGWLSHAAIQAREHGLPAVVGAAGALEEIRTGDLVRIAPDGRVEVIAERRSDARRAAAIEVRIRRTSGDVDGRLGNVSPGGALLLLASGRLEIGEVLALEGPSGIRHQATVVRNGLPGNYGLRLSDPLALVEHP